MPPQVQVSKLNDVLEKGHKNYNDNRQQYMLDYNETIECRKCLMLNCGMQVEGDKYKKRRFKCRESSQPQALQ